MSRSSSNTHRNDLQGLYRDRENGWIFGVCAGLAEYTGFGVMPVRIIAVIALLLFLVPTALVYAAAVLLLREKPLIYAGQRDEHEFWRCHRSHDRWSHS